MFKVGGNREQNSNKLSIKVNLCPSCKRPFKLYLTDGTGVCENCSSMAEKIMYGLVLVGDSGIIEDK